jgi:hypothetical protein
MTDKIKEYETIGCCGIDCGLCPRFYTIGESACWGCGGNKFKEKHPSCRYLTCCTIEKDKKLVAYVMNIHAISLTLRSSDMILYEY